MSVKLPTITPLKRLDTEPTFNEPWQAQVLAIAQNLIESGAIGAQTWSTELGAALERLQAVPDMDTADTYYAAALETLEKVLQSKCNISADEMKSRKSDWVEAYKSTPHGQPVKLS